MNPRTLQHQQAASKKWGHTHSPEIKDFWPQETFQDLTDFYIPVDPTWDKGKYSNERENTDDLFDCGPIVIAKSVNHHALEQIGKWRKRVDKWQAKIKAAKHPSKVFEAKLKYAKEQLHFYKNKL